MAALDGSDPGLRAQLYQELGIQGTYDPHSRIVELHRGEAPRPRPAQVRVRRRIATGAALVLAWARVTELGAFYAIWAGIGVVMAAVLCEPAFAVIASWFRDGAEQTRALLALTVLAGFASVICVPLAGWLVQTRGWRDALVALVVLLVPLTVLPNATLPGRRPDHLQRQPGQEPATPPATDGPDGVPLAQALHDQALWWLAAGFFAATLATSTVTVQVPYLREQQYSPGFAATWAGLLGAISVGGRVLVTALGSRWPLRSPPPRSSRSKPSRSWSSPCRADQLGWSASWPCSAWGWGSSPSPGPPWSPTSTAWPPTPASTASLPSPSPSLGQPPRWPPPLCAPPAAATTWSWPPSSSAPSLQAWP
jgi:Major Facilitator Superfamily